VLSHMAGDVLGKLATCHGEIANVNHETGMSRLGFGGIFGDHHSVANLSQNMRHLLWKLSGLL